MAPILLVNRDCGQLFPPHQDMDRPGAQLHEPKPASMQGT